MATVQVRTNKDGIVSYAAKIRMKGHPHAYATFERKTDANKWIQETESAIHISTASFGWIINLSWGLSIKSGVWALPVVKIDPVADHFTGFMPGFKGM